MTTIETKLAKACRWCGMAHGERCPTVKKMEFHPDGTVKSVEFITAADEPSVFDRVFGKFP